VLLLGLRPLGDVGRSVLQRDKLAAFPQIDQILELAGQSLVLPAPLVEVLGKTG
jgi:hypothetical protein